MRIPIPVLVEKHQVVGGVSFENDVCYVQLIKDEKPKYLHIKIDMGQHDKIKLTKDEFQDYNNVKMKMTYKGDVYENRNHIERSS